jgi:hypothetical protein
VVHGIQAWLSMRKATTEGLGSLRSATDSRCDIECVHEAPNKLKETLREEWGDCNAENAARKLGGPDFIVTNQSDKAVQIQKLAQLNEQVRRFAQEHGLAARPSETAVAPPKLWLEEVLVQARAEAKLPVALEWCKEMDVKTLDTLREAEMEQRFVDALELKEARAAVLLKRLKSSGA